MRQAPVLHEDEVERDLGGKRHDRRKEVRKTRSPGVHVFIVMESKDVESTVFQSYLVGWKGVMDVGHYSTMSGLIIFMHFD